MSLALPDPWWPVVALALITAVDGVLCVRPMAFVAGCLEDVRFPRRWWWTLAPLKFAAAAGLLAGLVVPGFAALTTVCLIAYFVVAISMHIRAHDVGRNLFVNATGMLLLCIATFVIGFAL